MNIKDNGIITHGYISFIQHRDVKQQLQQGQLSDLTASPQFIPGTRERSSI